MKKIMNKIEDNLSWSLDKFSTKKTIKKDLNSRKKRKLNILEEKRHNLKVLRIIVINTLENFSKKLNSLKLKW